MANLLPILPMPVKSGDTPPLMLEFSVNPETSPMLVSMTRHMAWVSPSKPSVRAAVMRTTPDHLFWLVVQSVISMNRTAKWGSYQPLSPNGIRQSAEYLKSYGLTNFELLIGPNTRIPRLTDPLYTSIPQIEAGWLPQGFAVMVPVDRNYVGFCMQQTGTDRMLAVVHNACRGICVLQFNV